MTKFLLIRHATTNAVGKRLSGRLPGVSLNTEGQRQAQQLAERLAGIPISAIYSSPLERAVETAASIAESHQVTCNICKDFVELDFGKWTNFTFEKLRDDPQFKLFNSFRSNTRIPGGEMMLEAQTRMITGLEKLRVQHPNQTVAVVSHADLIKGAVMHYAGIHLDLFHRIEISPASVSVVEVYDEMARIIQLNDTGKLNA